MSKDFRVVVAGGRTFDNYNTLCHYLDYMLSNKIAEGYNIIIVSGAARGADKLGERYAKANNYKIEQYIPDWNKGKGAGYARNCEMAAVADACIVFWNGISRGSKHMIDICVRLDVPVETVMYEEVAS